MLRLYTLGAFEICHQDRQALPKPATLKSQSLLAYLACHTTQIHHRESLVSMFWGDRPERKARRSLSTALWHIRRCLPDHTIILSDSNTVQINPDAPIWLDVKAFIDYAEQTDIPNLQAAATLYKGRFLDGFYDDWVMSERYRLESIYANVLAQLMVAYEAIGTHDEALKTAIQLLQQDPLREDAHRLAMRAYCRLGQRNAAIKQYEHCRQLLQDELGIEPLGETRDLWQAILNGRFLCTHQITPTPSITNTPQQLVYGYNPLDAVQHIPLVGREEELTFLTTTWQAALANQCSLILVSGEAGIGKTRLIEEFITQSSWRGYRILQGRCYEFEHLLPYQPFTEALRLLAPDLVKTNAKKLPPWVVSQIARLLPELLTQRADLTPLSQPTSKEQTQLFESLSLFLSRLASQEALLLILEDLHWATESVLQLLHYLARQLVTEPLLIVGTLRPEAVSPSHPLATVRRRLERNRLSRQLQLAPLSKAAVNTLISQLSGNGSTVNTLAERIFQETEGNPFYLIEIVKTLFEQGTIRLHGGVWQANFDALSQTDLPLPNSVEETIQARIDRLSQTAQDAAHVAAVIGKTFDYELLTQAWGLGEITTLAALDDLLRQRLIGEEFDGSDYTFTHHKIQEIVYQSLSRHRCLHLHRQVGMAMERLSGDGDGENAGELAYHFEQAWQLDKRLTEKTIAYLKKAGQYAVEHSANSEAISYYSRGLDILHTLPDTPKNLKQAFDLQIALCLPTTVVYGYGSPEAKGVYERANTLCQKLDGTPELFTILVGLSRYYVLAGDPGSGIELAEQLVTIAQTAEDSVLLVEACRIKGGTLFALGRLKEARTIFSHGAALYDLATHESHVYRFGHDPSVPLRGYLAKTLWMMGYPEQSLEECHKLHRLVQFMDHPSSLAIAHCLLAINASMRHDVPETRNHAEVAIQCSQLHRLPSWNALATALRGWALVEQGQVEEGLTQSKEGTTAWRATGNEHFAPFFLALQAEACLQAQKPSEGIAAVFAAQTIAQNGGDVYWMAELSRLHGELLRAQGRDGEETERHFRDALEIARQQQAKMLELRAVVSLCRLWQSQSRNRDAKRLLAEVYGRFDEGFETPDLQAAETLLRVLS